MSDSSQTIVEDIMAGSPLRAGSKLELPKGYRPTKAHHGRRSSVVVRKAEHKGRKIAIRTTYRIEIDGEVLSAAIHVGTDGMVSCHGLPNYSVRSAVDLVRKMIDVAASTTIPPDEIGGHGGHAHADRTSKSGRR